MDATTSSYSAGIIVVSGEPGSFVLHGCGPSATSFGATAGTTYHVLAFDYQGDGGGNGGTLRISFADAPPPPSIDVAIDPIGSVNARTGVATITGQITCSDASFVDVLTQLEQPVGRRAIVSGFGGFFAGGEICTGTPQRFSSQVVPENGTFVGGKSASFSFSVACGLAQCTFGYDEQTVKLRGAKA